MAIDPIKEIKEADPGDLSLNIEELKLLYNFALSTARQRTVMLESFRKRLEDDPLAKLAKSLLEKTDPKFQEEMRAEHKELFVAEEHPAYMEVVAQMNTAEGMILKLKKMLDDKMEESNRS